uniref:Tudor domain-containing protein n=1 Tax=Anopheles epiroticus TaxID=199890 RepID=A0A182PCZ7_9DIPT
MLDMPSDVMGLSRTIGKVDVLSYFAQGEVTNVRILHVLNPNRLWLRSVGQDPVVNKMYDELNECYHVIGHDRWCMEPNKVQHGLYCAVLWNGNWERGRIVGPLIGGRVKVYFIDIGMVELVDYQKMKFLSNVFSTVPEQAVRASLAGLIPRNGAWSRAESDTLTMLVNASPQHLPALTLNINHKLNALDIVLKEPNGDCFNENFFCIEEGHFPSIEEIRTSLARGLDYEELYSRLPHARKNGIVEQISRTTCENMVKLFDIKVVKNAKKEKGDEGNTSQLNGIENYHSGE